METYKKLQDGKIEKTTVSVINVKELEDQIAMLRMEKDRIDRDITRLENIIDTKEE